MTAEDKQHVINRGDIVQLNSGGTLMTAGCLSVSADAEIRECFWSVDGDIKSRSFPEEVLKLADEPTQSRQRQCTYTTYH